MFGKTNKKRVLPSVPAGISQLVLCVVDEKRKVLFRMHGGNSDRIDSALFIFPEDSSRVIDHTLLNDVVESRTALSAALTYGGGRRTYVHVLPYERKRNKWRFVCLQVTTVLPDPDTAEDPSVCALSRERTCLVLTDADQIIRETGSHIPETFGYASENLKGVQLQDLFNAVDREKIQAHAGDDVASINHCTFSSLDGSRREVELRKFALPDRFTLYSICDISPRQRGEELAEAAARERQRIGQDLHDSIGQTLTGISLLSRSLSNILKRDGHAGSSDASQISGLADEASNQIRQISRGLLPSEMVQNGLCASLRELARMTTESCGILCEVQLDEALTFPDVAVETHLYRIAQEAVNNAIRHSAAGRIDIAVSEAAGMIRLQVTDDGRWIEPEANVIGIGLKTMEYRAAAIGGRLQISTTRQGGTQVTCQLETDESLAANA